MTSQQKALVAFQLEIRQASACPAFIEIYNKDQALAQPGQTADDLLEVTGSELVVLTTCPVDHADG